MAYVNIIKATGGLSLRLTLSSQEKAAFPRRFDVSGSLETGLVLTASETGRRVLGKGMTLDFGVQLYADNPGDYSMLTHMKLTKLTAHNKDILIDTAPCNRTVNVRRDAAERRGGERDKLQGQLDLPPGNITALPPRPTLSLTPDQILTCMESVACVQEHPKDTLTQLARMLVAVENQIDV